MESDHRVRNLEPHIYVLYPSDLDHTGPFEPVLGIHDILVRIRIRTSDKWIRIQD
jgi:hypothetical protein